MCEDIDKANRDFFWGHKDNRKPPHLVNWETTSKPKRLGGLSIKATSQANQALLAKTSWRLHQKDTGLWASMLNHKYLASADLCTASRRIKPYDSPTWKGICHGIDLLNKGLCWRIGNGETANFWRDNWMNSGPIMIKATVPVVNLEVKVKHFVDHNGWKLEELSKVLPQSAIKEIAPIPVLLNSDIEDKIIWSQNANGIFSVRPAYDLHYQGQSTENTCWEKIWKINVPPKIKIFLWELHGKLLTNDHKMHRKMTTNPACTICNHPKEDLQHLFRECPNAKQIIGMLPRQRRSLWANGLNFQTWVKSNINSGGRGKEDQLWVSVFCLTLWYTWKWRCKQIFEEDQDTNPLSYQTTSTALNDWIIANGDGNTNTAMLWKPPDPDHYKINTDGTYNTRTKSIGAGGLMRDNNGTWVRGFSINLGIGDILQAELWGIW